jgi:hypothetical protein
MSKRRIIVGAKAPDPLLLRYETPEEFRFIAIKYNCTTSTISRISRKETYKSILQGFSLVASHE